MACSRVRQGRVLFPELHLLKDQELLQALSDPVNNGTVSRPGCFFCHCSGAEWIRRLAGEGAALRGCNLCGGKGLQQGGVTNSSSPHSNQRAKKLQDQRQTVGGWSIELTKLALL